MARRPVRLRQPTDFMILEALFAYGRNVATNLAEVTGKSRKNINNRLPMLEDYGLVRKIGPAERSGLYEITAEGETALKYRDQYGQVDDFEALIEEHADRATDGNPGRAAPMLRNSSDEESQDAGSDDD